MGSFLPAEDMSTMSLPMPGQMIGGSSGEQHVDLKPLDNSEAEDALRAAETVYRLAMQQQIVQEVELSQDLLVYPEGEVGAVTVTEGDVEGLHPGRFLSDNIVDFYIKFLERGLSPRHGNRFYFFNSFFFRKLLQSTASTGIDPCKVDYEQLRNWTTEVNLFAKDYVFIPILKSSHWSLVVICHLSSLTRPPGEMRRSPCVVHLDPIAGQHESFEGLIRSYVLQAWMDRFQVSSNGDQLLALCQMKYVEAKVPQQDNSYDCGLYVLNYIEAFLKESTSSNFSFPSSETGPHFITPNFVPEVLGKRRHIQDLIHKLSGISQKRAKKRKAIQEVLQSTENLRFLLFDEGHSETCMKDVEIVGPTLSNGQGSEIIYASTHENALDAPHRQSSLISSGDNEALGGSLIGHLEYQNRSASLLPKQQHAEPEVQTVGPPQKCVKLSSQGHSETCIKDVEIIGPTLSNGQGFEIMYASTREDARVSQHRQSTLISSGDIEPLGGPHIGHLEYENRSECLSPKQPHVGATHFHGPIFEAKHASTHEDAMDVQCQQSSGISRLEYEPLDGPELRHPEPEVISCMDLSGGLKGKNKRRKTIWTKEDTWVLLSCKVEGGRFCKGSRGATHWNLISEEIGKQLRSFPSADQCRLRYDTLLKAYKRCKEYCMKTGKTFSAITEEERLELRLATTLSEEWYTRMDEICDKANISQKRVKLSFNVCHDLHPLSSPAPNPAPSSQERSFEVEAVALDSASAAVVVALRDVIPASGFSFFNEDLQSTLLNLVQECSLEKGTVLKLLGGKVFYLAAVCRRLAVVQDREPREILKLVDSTCHNFEVFTLWKLDFVNVLDMVFEEGNDLAHIDHWKHKTWFLKSDVYKKISKEVLCKNHQFQTYCDSFLIERPFLQYIKVLQLYSCHELKHLDMRELPSLQFLDIRFCPKLNSVTGWEVATGLGSLHITWCNAYHDYPEVRHLLSLREFELDKEICIKPLIPLQLSEFSQCAKLQRLEICNDQSFSEIVDLEDLKELKFLEFLSLTKCDFSSIQGLSGLQALTTLHLTFCPRLERVAGLGCLKGLIHLNMMRSGVTDVVGVEELHLLTKLDLFGCRSLKWFPFLGHLKALVFVDIRKTSVKDVPSREDFDFLSKLDFHYTIQ